jgi:hypothetical protein
MTLTRRCSSLWASSRSSATTKTAVSSAKPLSQLLSLISRVRGRLEVGDVETGSRYSTGPNKDPCLTPYSTSTTSDTWPSQTMRCFALVRLRWLI